MDFRSLYQHGFARVAACTARVAIADPQANAEAVLRQARACSEEGVAVVVLPELTLTGYSIEDLLHQDAVLDGVEDALRTVVDGTADLLPVTLELAHEIAGHPVEAVQGYKALIDEGYAMGLDEALAMEHERSVAHIRSMSSQHLEARRAAVTTHNRTATAG